MTEILAAIFLLGFCIFFHELGHFLMGKLTGIEPKVFSIGYGRGIFKKTIGKTTYQLTAIPLGGYVQFYGDDISEEQPHQPGDFFYASPLRRIIVAAGGPLFSFLLGFLVIYILILGGWQGTTTKIMVIQDQPPVPAEVAGLKTGDEIVAINGNKVRSFEEIYYYIGLADKPRIRVDFVRDGKQSQVIVNAKRSQPGMPFVIGIRPFGKPSLVIQRDTKMEKGELLKGDRLVRVAGKKVGTIRELRRVLEANIGKTVEIEAIRKGATPVTVSQTVQKKEVLVLEKLLDPQTEQVIDRLEIGSWEPKRFQKIFIDGVNYTSWAELRKAVKTANPRKASIAIRAVSVKVKKIKIEARGMLGVMLSESQTMNKTDLKNDPITAISRAVHQSVFTTKSTLVGLYRVIQGSLSFRKSVSGPVKIAAIAAESVRAGWDYYWFLLAQITIVLGIMNILPIPVLDGGHILFYIIEAVYKPLPKETIMSITRIFMALLIGFGIYVIGQDIFDVFLK